MKNEQKMIDEYHKKVLEIKGDSALFISNETLNTFVLKRYKEVPFDSIKKGDNICFFDDNENVFYQINCNDVIGDKIIVKCLNLSTMENYITTFEIEKIIDLKDKNISEIRVFRKK